MSTRRDDLVGLALDALDAAEAERVRGAVETDPALAAELQAIERHLALHDRVPQLRPAAGLWEAIRDRLDEEPARRSLLQRFWMPAAAAALVAAALFWPPAASAPAPTRLHGDVARTPAGAYSCTRVSRMRLGNGVTVTLDAGTALDLPAHERLVLRAGRVFLVVPRGHHGFTVEAGELTVVTTGTAFLVERTPFTYVWTESGRVRCTAGAETRVVGPGETFLVTGAPGAALPPTPRAWFTRPTVTVRILDARTIRVVIQNEMPDALQVAPLTGGEPLFFASFGGHDHPLAPEGFDAPLTLAPNTRQSFDLRLPRPLPDREALLVSYPAGGIRVEATR
ncbi:MAG: FecR domain-containing protein [Planctomycetota bacterium]|jgi:ferric-dicitrate binding protein FerR (iron transport regulator)